MTRVISRGQLRALLAIAGTFTWLAATPTVHGQTRSVEFEDFPNPKRVGVDPIDVGTDTVLVGFDQAPDGSPIAGGTLVDSVYESVGLRLSALLTSGPKAGARVDCQALDFQEAPTFLSSPNILSGVDPNLPANSSGEVAGTATIIVTFLTASGSPGRVDMAGAFNDRYFDKNTLTAYSGPNATGANLGTVSATGEKDFFGLSSSEGIGSITFSGHSTEVDDLVFTAPRLPPPSFGVEVHQPGPRCISLTLTNNKPIKGGEIAIAYDPTIAVPLMVFPGPDFPQSGVIQFGSSPSNSCSQESAVPAGFTVGWLNSAAGSTLLPRGKHNLLKVCFALAPGAKIGDCTDLRFVQCLGPPEAPIMNIVTGADDQSIPLGTTDGTICLQQEIAFRRGDANTDGKFDISDPIAILGCLFLGTDCSTCPDSNDANDDGAVNIADPTFLLNWRFLGGPTPPVPFPECGLDAVTDLLDECEAEPSC